MSRTWIAILMAIIIVKLPIGQKGTPLYNGILLFVEGCITKS
ncbi:hypothetical protein [Ehrlichia ruminantium]|nr:hypothetical protein [Ehrlichia ruminantium]